MSFVVAIDGPAGTGKGTVTKIVAEKLNLVNVDTGAMYRSVTLKALENNIQPTETDKLEKMLQDISIELKDNNGVKQVLLDGNDVTEKIRTPKIDQNVSKFAQIAIVREKMTPLQRKMGETQNIIMEVMFLFFYLKKHLLHHILYNLRGNNLYFCILQF